MVCAVRNFPLLWHIVAVKPFPAPGTKPMEQGAYLVDIGCNLTHDSFDADRDEVIERALAAGVGRIVVTGSSAESSRQAAELAGGRPKILYATAGVHPHHAADYTLATEQLLRRLAAQAEVVAIGECGLDYFRNYSPRAAQRDAFAAQLEIAAASGLPVFLHQREADEEFVEILSPWLPRLSRAVAHCFTGDRKMLHRYLDLGLYIGITGWICDERRGGALRDAAPALPLDRVMIETDAPYLLPRSLHPRPATRRNEPACLREVLRVLAEASGHPAAVLARASTENAERFFDLR